MQEAETVETAEPERLGARSCLIEAYHRLGRAKEAQNQLPEAEKQFRAMHELAARWVKAEPESATASDLLASSYFRLGRVLAPQRRRRRRDELWTGHRAVHKRSWPGSRRISSTSSIWHSR